MSVRSPVTFAANGEYFVSGGTDGVRVWRMEDGKLMATIRAEHVQCVAFSKDGKWIAAGTYDGDLMVFDAKTHRYNCTTWRTNEVIRGVDFSPNSTQLVVFGDHIATVWDIATHALRVGPLRHEDYVLAAKYSPEGDRIATATQKSVRVYDGAGGRLLADMSINVAPWYNSVLLWFNNHLGVISDSGVKQVDASTGSQIWEWPVPSTSKPVCIAIPKHGESIAYSANRTVTFWDTSTHSQFGLVYHPEDIHSIALSPDSRFLAIGGENESITIKRLSRVTEPEIQIDDTALDCWRHDQLADAEASLTTATPLSRHVLASRALVRARLERWGEAIDDAEKSIAIEPSIMAYIAKSVSLVGKGKKREAYRACDIAFEHSHSTHVSFILLIKAVVVCMAGEHDDAISRVDDLIATLHLNSICYVVQAYMRLLLGNSRMESGDYEDAIQSFEHARTQLRPETSHALTLISLISGWKFDDLDIMIRQGLCEALYAAGRTREAGESLLQIVNTVDKEVYMRRSVTTWISGFLHRCLSTPDNMAPPHETLHPELLTSLLKEWAKLKLKRGPWIDTLTSAIAFMVPRFTIYRTICEQLDMFEKITDATGCFHQMVNEVGGEANLPIEQVPWAVEFRQHLLEKLEGLGDAAMSAQRHDAAIFTYSTALSLDPASRQGLLIKRSKACVLRGLWENGLNDANAVIELDPLSPWGYERKHAALHRAGRYDDAISTFETMLLKISQSPDPKIRERRQGYVMPAQTKAAIRKTVQLVIRGSPRVLIDTNTGRLLDKANQALLFESLPVFNELVSSMTTHIDVDHIQREVEQYYRYATFSHTWEDNEPLFEKVVQIVVYDLEESFTHDKLRVFCRIAREAGLHWAWSDTCCINKADHIVLQEALVAMFKWYEGSAITIVFLRGVRSPSRRGDLMKSIWNTRGWTFQEYHASKVVRFYTEDWKPYLDLDIPNHKESREIIEEMEEATGVSAQALKDLRPGLGSIRDKLCLASRRETTYVEDAAYSLLGIFSISLPIVYGEADHALGRLLAQLLTSSGDTSILAWTGKSGTFNSCLPANIIVFDEPPSSHIPEMEAVSFRTRKSSPSFTLVTKLYDRLFGLPVPSFANQRMRLPCLTFKLGPVMGTRTESGYVFRARTGALGVVEIKTTEDLSRSDSLTLVHPWIDFLLDRQPVEGTTDMIFQNTDYQASPTRSSPSPSTRPNTAPTGRPARSSSLMSRFGLPFKAGDSGSLLSPPPVTLTDRRDQGLRFISRLKQPFGALLFTRIRQNVEEYRRVAPESLITVQVEELSSTVLNKLIEGACTLDVL